MTFISAITEDEVREHFVSCGKIESVRIIRDRKSGVGRGVGYINFEEEDSVTLALEMDDTKLKNRPVRVKQYTASPKKDKKKKNKGGQKQDQKFKNGKGQNPNAHVSIQKLTKVFAVRLYNIIFLIINILNYLF